MTIFDRFKLIADNLYGLDRGNIKKLLENLNITRQALQDYQKRDHLSYRISTKCKELGINPEWVETGEGNMLLEKPKSLPPPASDNLSLISILSEINAKLDLLLSKNDVK
jgi:hypothetical protein